MRVKFPNGDQFVWSPTGVVEYFINGEAVTEAEFYQRYAAAVARWRTTRKQP